MTHKYVITNHANGGYVVLGPMQWRPVYFSSVLTDDLDEEVVITSAMEQSVPFETKGYTVRRALVEYEDLLDPKFDQHEGPVWTYYDTNPITIDGVQYHAKATYTRAEKPRAGIEIQLRNEIAAERYNREIKGISVTIRGKPLTVSTDRASRDRLVSKFVVMGAGAAAKWKFPEGYQTLTKPEVQTILEAIDAHVQAQFDWEESTLTQIQSAANTSALKQIKVKDAPEL